MPNVLSSQILENGPRFIVAKYTNVSDGTAETGVTKLDATSTGPFGIRVPARSSVSADKRASPVAANRAPPTPSEFSQPANAC